MSPDSEQTRLGRLETDMARLGQQVGGLATDVTDLAHDVRAFAPLTIAVAELNLKLGHVESEQKSTAASIDALHRRWDEDARERTKRQEQQEKEGRDKEDQRRKEARVNRNWLITTAVGVTSIIIAAFAAITGAL